VGRLGKALQRKRILVGDGAWGTELQARGLEPGSCPELWNVLHPEVVSALARDYARAGADMVLTNTFGGSAPVLRRHGLEDRLEELNEAGARLSIEGAAGKLVAASIGPSGELLAPLGELSEEQLQREFERQLRTLLGAGVRIFCVETMIAVEEAACAVRAAKALAVELGVEVEVMATMTFDPTPEGFRTAMGVDCRKAVQVLSAAGADVLGSNCGNGIEQMVPIASELRGLTDKPILIQPNAGLPQLEGGRTVYRQTPEHMARWVPELAAAGATIIGGCCGTTPEHIRAIRREVDRLL
jgi:5-methyltetrahydrofolate--homocysteine methyltransferase